MIKTHLSLVLVDSFLQSKYTPQTQKQLNCHNPYFNRWISAIYLFVLLTMQHTISHNPYFNRWISAIYLSGHEVVRKSKSQSLF